MLGTAHNGSRMETMPLTVAFKISDMFRISPPHPVAFTQIYSFEDDLSSKNNAGQNITKGVNILRISNFSG